MCAVYQCVGDVPVCVQCVYTCAAVPLCVCVCVRRVSSIYSLRVSFLVTYDPGDDEDLHPGEGGGLHAEQLGGVVLGGHVGQQGRALEAVGRVHHQQEQEDHQGRRVGHELQEGPTHHPAQLG